MVRCPQRLVSTQQSGFTFAYGTVSTPEDSITAKSLDISVWLNDSTSLSLQELLKLLLTLAANFWCPTFVEDTAAATGDSIIYKSLDRSKLLDNSTSLLHVAKQ